MTRALSILALLWASAAAANTNSLSVYCLPPTNAPALSESALHIDRYDRILDITNRVQLAAIYDMMCERIDVPQFGFAYSRDKRGQSFDSIGTNRNAIAASRVLKYDPLVQLCGDVCDFLKSANSTNIGFYTVYPMTFGFEFDAANRDTWTDVTAPTGAVDNAYSITAPVLSPGRNNYGYQFVFGYRADTVRNYNPSSSVIPFWLGALSGVTHFAAPAGLGDGSFDAASRIVDSGTPLVNGGPREVRAYDARNVREIMQDGLPRVPYWIVFAQAAELVAPLRYSCFSVNGPLYFQNQISTIDAEYEISARELLDFGGGLDEDGCFQLNVPAYLKAGSSEQPTITSSMDAAPRYSRSRWTTETDTHNISCMVEYLIQSPTAGMGELLPIAGWVFINTVWVNELGEYRDAYQGDVPNIVTCLGTNYISCTGSVKCRTVITEVDPFETREPGPTMGWPSPDALSNGYFADAYAWMFASCEYDDRITQVNGRTNMVYDLYGRRMGGTMAPSNSVNELLRWYQQKSNLPRNLETPWGNESLKVKVMITRASDLDIGGASSVIVYCPVGETPEMGNYWFPQGGEDSWTVEYDISPGIMVFPSGTGQCKVTYQSPAVMGRVKWNFLDVGPQR